MIPIIDLASLSHSAARGSRAWLLDCDGEWLISRLVDQRLSDFVVTDHLINR
jgi:hypothetical protein